MAEEGEATAVTPGEDSAPPERKVNHRKIVVTEVVSPNNFWAQLVDQGGCVCGANVCGCVRGCMCVCGWWFVKKGQRMDNVLFKPYV